MREKIEKSRFTVFFQWFVAPEGRKVGSLKRRVRSQLARWDMKKCTPLWREAHFQVKMDETLEERTTFGSCDVEKVHAVVARSTFWSQNVQNTATSDHFWKLRCRKSARRCGAKHIWKSKCTKHRNLGPLLEVAMSKKCTPLWREAHLEGPQRRALFRHRNFQKWSEVAVFCTFWLQNVLRSKCTKTHQCGFSTFGSSDVEKVHAVVARSTFPSQNVQNTTCSRHFWRFRMLEKCTPLWREAHFQVKMYKTPHVRAAFGGSDVPSLRFTTLHYITLHYTPLHYITLHYTTFHYTPLH